MGSENRTVLTEKSVSMDCYWVEIA